MLISLLISTILFLFFFFFNDTATTEIYTLSLHDALPISCTTSPAAPAPNWPRPSKARHPTCKRDRKSTRLNSSHSQISYAVFCLKKKKKKKKNNNTTITQHNTNQTHQRDTSDTPNTTVLH